MAIYFVSLSSCALVYIIPGNNDEGSVGSTPDPPPPPLSLQPYDVTAGFQRFAYNGSIYSVLFCTYLVCVSHKLWVMLSRELQRCTRFSCHRTRTANVVATYSSITPDVYYPTMWFDMRSARFLNQSWNHFYFCYVDAAALLVADRLQLTVRPQWAGFSFAGTRNSLRVEGFDACRGGLLQHVESRPPVERCAYRVPSVEHGINSHVNSQQPVWPTTATIAKTEAVGLARYLSLRPVRSCHGLCTKANTRYAPTLTYQVRA